MGMFDYVDYDGPLPKRKGGVSKLRAAMRNGASQTKSLRLWETEKFGQRAYDFGCVTVTVDRAGIMYDPDGQPMDWTGTMRFYGATASQKWWEFEADIKRGLVKEIRDVTDDTP